MGNEKSHPPNFTAAECGEERANGSYFAQCWWSKDLGSVLTSDLSFLELHLRTTVAYRFSWEIISVCLQEKSSQHVPMLSYGVFALQPSPVSPAMGSFTAREQWACFWTGFCHCYTRLTPLTSCTQARHDNPVQDFLDLCCSRMSCLMRGCWCCYVPVGICMSSAGVYVARHSRAYAVT